MNRSRVFASLGALTIVLSPLLAVADFGRAGPEIIVGTPPSIAPGTGVRPVAAAADGSFVVVYTDDVPGTGEGHIRAQRYDPTGLPVGGAIQVSTYASSYQTNASVARTPDGRFVVVWQSYQQDGSGFGVFAQRFDAAGAAVGTEFQVNAYTTDAQSEPHVAAAADGRFLIVWESAGDGDDTGVFGQRYDSSGVADGGVFQVNTDTTGPQFDPIAAMDDDGNAAVVWGSGEESPYTIKAQRYDAAGAAAGTEFQVNTSVVSITPSPDADMSPDGEMTVVWPRGLDVLAGQRFDSAGAPAGTEFEQEILFGNFENPGGHVGVGVADDGAFLVSWRESLYRGPSAATIPAQYARLYDSFGTPAGDKFRVETTRPTTRSRSGVAATVDDGFVVVWTNDRTIAHESRVLAQRYCDPSDASCDICPGFDDSSDGDADGIPDGCDPCTNPGGAHDATVKKLSLRRGVGPRALFRLMAEMVAGQAFDALDPHINGARVIVQSTDVGHVVDVTLPDGLYAGRGTEGWELKGTKWIYRNGLPKGAEVPDVVPRNGVRMLQILDNSAKAPNLMRIKLKGRGGYYHEFTNYADLPLSATVTLGGPAEAAVGLCTELSWTSDECRYAPCCYEETAAVCK